MFAGIAKAMVEGAVSRFRQVLIAPLIANAEAGQTMRDGTTLFHSTRGNLAAAGAPPSPTTLGAARVAMRRQKDSRGNNIAFEPYALLVPPEQELAGQQSLAQITANKWSESNPFANNLQLIVEPGLANANAWYLLADPSLTDGLSYCYLDGHRMPQIQVRDGWNVLGSEFRLIWSIGAAFTESLSWYKNPGV